jgi:hypothetical protein
MNQVGPDKPGAASDETIHTFRAKSGLNHLKQRIRPADDFHRMKVLQVCPN